MSSKPRRQFTPQQKAEAVRIVTQSGKPISQIAKEMGLSESALRNWVKQAQIDQAAAPNGSLHRGTSRVEPSASGGQTVADGARFPKKGQCLLCSPKQPYELIEAEKANFPIARQV